MLAEVGLTLNIRNNRTYPIQISVLGGPVNPLDTANATTEYRWDVTALALSSSDTLILKYKINGAANFSIFTAQIIDGNLESVIISLNNLGIGYFQYYVESGQSYFSTYNDNYEFGELDITSNVIPPPPPPPPPPPVFTFFSSWDSTIAGASGVGNVTLPLESTGNYNFIVDWGDGNQNTITAYNQPEVTHTYTIPGLHVISFSGTVEGFRFNNGGDRLKLMAITSWGTLKLGNSGGYFYGCQNLNLTAVTDVLNLTGTTTLFRMFEDCGTLTTINNINSWDVSSVTNMARLFTNCVSFNQSLNSWDVSSVTTMSNLFANCNNFNQNINSWNTSSVIDMGFTFWKCFNYNQPLNNWDVSSVTTMAFLFSECVNFNQDLSSWDVGNVTSMAFMFNVTPFNNGGNPAINNWNTSSLTTIWYMFRYSYFNQPVGNWDVSNVTDMEGAFTAAWNFNQNIGNWDTSSVTRMSLMFASDGVNNNLPFNQNLGNWNISNVTTMVNFMFGKNSSNFTSINFANTLCGWVATAPNSISINFGSARYCNTAVTCFNTLVATKGWGISSGGVTAICV